MKKLFVRAAITAVALIAGPALLAQDASSLTATLEKLIGSTKSFTSKVEVKITSDLANLTLPFKLGASDSKMRLDLDLNAVDSASIPDIAKIYFDNIKKAGLSQWSAIVNPGTKKMYVVSEGLRGYTEQDIPDSAASAEDIKIEKTEAGKETVNGHPTVKNKVKVTANGQTTDFTIWNATDLKDFPVKIESELPNGAGTLVVNLKDVKLTGPEASKFEAPKGLTKYDDMQAFGAAVMAKIQ